VILAKQHSITKIFELRKILMTIKKEEQAPVNAPNTVEPPCNVNEPGVSNSQSPAQSAPAAASQSRKRPCI
jgi:hypothetical protein